MRPMSLDSISVVWSVPCHWTLYFCCQIRPMSLDSISVVWSVPCHWTLYFCCQIRPMSSDSVFLLSDPSHVIGLYPNLLPQDYRNLLEYPDLLPELEGGELEKGLLSLIEYLTQVSNDLRDTDWLSSILQCTRAIPVIKKSCPWHYADLGSFSILCPPNNFNGSSSHKNVNAQQKK